MEKLYIIASLGVFIVFLGRVLFKKLGGGSYQTLLLGLFICLLGLTLTYGTWQAATEKGRLDFGMFFAAVGFTLLGLSKIRESYLGDKTATSTQFWPYYIYLALAILYLGYLYGLTSKFPKQPIIQVSTEPQKTIVLSELPLPKTGIITKAGNEEFVAPFKIEAPRDSSAYVKLVNHKSQKTVVTLFLRKGATSQIKVPLGTYEVKYASGEKWYGDKAYFGYDTVFAKANHIFEFKREGRKLSGYSITLYTVSNGNLNTSTIDASEF